MCTEDLNTSRNLHIKCMSFFFNSSSRSTYIALCLLTFHYLRPAKYYLYIDNPKFTIMVGEFSLKMAFLRALYFQMGLQSEEARKFGFQNQLGSIKFSCKK